MNPGVRYPYMAAIARAKELSTRMKLQLGNYFNVVQQPSFDELRKLGANYGAIIVENEKVPGDKEAVLIDVEGINYILLDKRFRRKSTNRNFCLGHELGHLVLKHRSTFVGNLVMAFSEKPYNSDQALQVLYENEREMEANFFSMMLLAPDPYLDAIVDKSIFISAQSLAAALDVELGTAVARIELYRNMFGYERTFAAARRVKRRIDESRIVSTELPSSCGGLELFLPMIRSQLLPFIQ